MRIHEILLLATLAVSAAAVGCGPNEVDMGAGGGTPTPTSTGTPTPTPSPSATPNPAMFASVQSFMEDPAKANCGQSALCHLAPGNGGLIFVTMPAGGVAAGDVASNRDQLSCLPNIDDYTPSGLIIQTFCNPAGTAQVAPQHSGRTNLVDADCAALFAWLQTGTGTPTNCP